MKNSVAINRFLKRLVAKYIVFIAVAAVVFYFFAPQHYFSLAPAVFLYFFLLNIIVYRLLVKSHSLTTVQFSRSFMVITAIKFFASLTFAIAYMVVADENPIPFLVIFIILYFSSLIQVVNDFRGFLNKKNSQ